MKNLELPGKVENYSVTGIGYQAFVDSEIEKIVLHNSLKQIGERAFINSSLKEISIPTSVKIIDDCAFANCDGLTCFFLPQGVDSVGWNPLTGCGNVNEIKVSTENHNFDSREDCNAIIETANNKLISACRKTKIPVSVTAIGDDAFRNVYEGTSLNLSSSVTSIGRYAFAGSNYLEKVNISANVQYVGDGSFAFSRQLTSISVSKENPCYDSRNNCNSIIKTSENKLVVGCKKTVIPDDIVSIGKNAFRGCAIDEHFQIPSSVSYIGSFAFGSTDFVNLVLPDNITVIDTYAFNQCNKLQSVVKLPSQLKTISNSLFSECKNLKKVSIPSSVVKIGKEAFENCSSLEEIEIPASVVTIEDRAFGDSGLRKVIFKGHRPERKWYRSGNPFEGVGSKESPALLIVPAAYLNEYEIGETGYWEGGYFRLQALEE